MNILKNNIKRIVLIIILILISSGIGVFATYNYLASDVKYTDDKSVADALNDLYEKKKNYILPNGIINITENGNHDVANYSTANINVIPQNSEIIYESSTEGTETYTIKETDVEKYSMLFVVLASGNDTGASTTQTFSSTATLNKLLDNAYTTNGYGRLWLSIGYVTNFSKNDTITMFSWFAAQKRICGILK